MDKRDKTWVRIDREKAGSSFLYIKLKLTQNLTSWYINSQQPKELTRLSLLYLSSGVSSQFSLVSFPRRPVNSQSNDTRQHLGINDKISWRTLGKSKKRFIIADNINNIQNELNLRPGHKQSYHNRTRNHTFWHKNENKQKAYSSHNNPCILQIKAKMLYHIQFSQNNKSGVDTLLVQNKLYLGKHPTLTRWCHCVVQVCTK